MFYFKILNLVVQRLKRPDYLNRGSSDPEPYDFHPSIRFIRGYWRTLLEGILIYPEIGGHGDSRTRTRREMKYETESER